MTELERDVQDNQGIKKKPTRETQPPDTDRGRSHTEGRDDYDETGESRNLGHGHPEEEHRGQLDRERSGPPAKEKRRRGVHGGHAGQGRRDSGEREDHDR